MNPTLVDILNWFQASGGTEETKGGDLSAFTQQELAVVFKHSQTCPVSWMANRHVQSFTQAHPEVPLYTLIVQKERGLSNQLAEVTGIRHESPQILVFRRGQVVSDASHGDITTQYLIDTTRG
jgi:bacillithiol system protein YtxJ